MSKNLPILTFLATFNTWLVQSTSEYQKILVNDVDLVTGYNILQYVFGIQVCSTPDSQLQDVNNTESGIFAAVSQHLMSIFSAEMGDS